MAAERPLPVDDAEADGLFRSLADEASIAIAVSGGPDSLALAALMARWQARLERTPGLHALVVDHGLRPGSPGEARRTGQALKGLGIDFTIVTLTGLPLSNLHAAARIARYDAMTDWMALNGFDLLATAHHRDDQLETIIMRMARDTYAGAAGIPASGWWADRRVVRPLLDLPKSRLTATVRALGLDPVLDPSNDDPRFERARVRRAIGQGQLSSPVSELMARARDAASLQDELDTSALTLAGEVLHLLPHGVALLDADACMDAERPVRRWLLRSLARDMGGSTVPPSREKIARLEQCVCDFASGERARGFAGATLAGVRFQRANGPERRKTIVVSREQGRRAVAPIVPEPGLSCLFDRRFRIVTSVEHVCRGLRIAAGQGVARRCAEDIPAAVPASAAASVPLVFEGENPLFPLVSGQARARGIAARWCGLRFGKHRLSPPC